MKLIKFITLALVLSFFSTNAYAQKSKRGTPEEAIAMVRKVKRMYSTIGPEKTFLAVKKLSHGLRDRDLYPYIVHFDGYMAAHFIPALRGLNFVDHTDMTGRYFFRNMITVLKTKGKGWASYSFPNPITKKVEEKSAYVERLDNEYFVGVGIFSKLSDDKIIN
ncbi:MAG: cache domain-containing protein [Methyloligellaceae bacterium]